MDAITNDFVMFVVTAVIIPMSLGFIIGYCTHKWKKQ